MPLDDPGVDHQPLADVLQRAEDDVGRQEGLGQGDPPAGGGGVRGTATSTNTHTLHPKVSTKMWTEAAVRAFNIPKLDMAETKNGLGVRTL